jgi:tetratricopeptide (TPR) repeat protein
MTSDQTQTQTQIQLQQLHKLEQAGRFNEAGTAYQQLLAKNPGHPFLLWGLGRCMMHFGRRNSAAQLLQQAVAAYPTHQLMTEDVIHRLILVGHPEAALRLCEEARARFPERVSIALHRVDALRLLNRHEEAIPLLREILNTPAAPAGAVLRLIACLRQTGNTQEALQLAAQTLPGYDGNELEQAGVLNEMAHAQENLGEYQSAFDSLCTSGEIARRSQEVQSVDAEKYPRLLHSQLALLEAQGLPTPPDYSRNDHPRLVFQVGFPRSGTTLVESVLAAHPQVQTSGEAPLWSTALGVLLAAGLPMDTMLEEIPRQPIMLLEQARKAYWDKVRAEFGSEFDLFVDKQPMNIIYLAHIRLLFPEASIIFCERDPRDVCLSCFFQWFQINSSNIHFLDWHDTATFYRQVMDYWLALRPLLADAVYTLRYEEFVGDFEGEAKKLFDFLQLNWDEGLLTFHEKNRERYFHTPSNQAVREGVKATASSRRYHYPDAIEEVQPLLEPILRELGY